MTLRANLTSSTKACKSVNKLEECCQGILRKNHQSLPQSSEDQLPEEQLGQAMSHAMIL